MTLKAALRSIIYGQVIRWEKKEVTFPKDFFSRLISELNSVSTTSAGSTWAPGKVEKNAGHSINEQSIIRWAPIFRRYWAIGALSWPDMQVPGWSWYDQKPLRHICLAKKNLKGQKKAFQKHIKDLNGKWPGIKEDLVGEPYAHSLGMSRSLETEANIRSNYYLGLFNRIAQGLGIERAVEIGCGYGGLAQKLLAAHPKLKLGVLDLPTMLPFAYYYLQQNFKEVHVSFDQEKFDLATLPRASIVGPWNFENFIGNFKPQIAINTCSFQHMSIENLNYYFSTLANQNVRYIFSINRLMAKRSGEASLRDFIPHSRYTIIEQHRMDAYDPDINLLLLELTR